MKESGTQVIADNAGYIFLASSSSESLKNSKTCIDLATNGKTWNSFVTFSVIFLAGADEKTWKTSVPDAEKNTYDVGNNFHVMFSKTFVTQFYRWESSSWTSEGYFGSREFISLNDDNTAHVSLDTDKGVLVLKYVGFCVNEDGSNRYSDAYKLKGNINWNIYIADK